jgi:folate-binding protein YgfZ
MQSLAALPSRSVIAIDGDDRVAFLQGLVSNDVALAVPGQAVWAALLSPQGKWLADFFILSDGDRLLLDHEAAQTDMLLTRLSRYRLRMKITLSALPDIHVHVAWPDRPDLPGIAAPDPRPPHLAWRILSDIPLPANATAEDWDLVRLKAGLPDGSRDMESDRSVLLEGGFDELGGVSWTKGCYMGQELTARTKYRGLLKRRLVPVRVTGPLPPPGTIIERNGADVGTMRSGRGTLGMAVLRLEALDGEDLRCAEALLTPTIPAWMRSA